MTIEEKLKKAILETVVIHPQQKGIVEDILVMKIMEIITDAQDKPE